MEGRHSMTKKERLFKMSGKAFIRTTPKCPCIEDIPDMQRVFKKLAEDNGLTYEEDDHHIAVGDRFWMKPTLHREEKCKVIFTPTSYRVYIGSRILNGDKHKDCILTDTGFYVIAYNGSQINYTLEETHE
jgi:hypothetical protein